ncbi:hypothetical protein [Falsiroseomonas selenitidurans]|uniref:J domain-containing protein n=1 Tax=Falsiroseomonas selenitidurans TaxID=2716335 RepID=A0ABX1ED43_9PROT|nr:hypothetical protein [Falsiroseomonas selenitidurans]NKC33683.1 hypothetical protein [Falsiroseomonas selenitidurans]
MEAQSLGIMLAGLVMAALVLWLLHLLRRAVRALRGWAGLLRRPRLGGLRLAYSRALARSESARAAALAAEVARLRVELRLARAPEPRFQRAKREFARRFHPDRLPRRTPDRPLRIALFREYWAVLRRIERDG